MLYQQRFIFTIKVRQTLINTGSELNHAITIAKKIKVNTEIMKKNIEQFLKASP